VVETPRAHKVKKITREKILPLKILKEMDDPAAGAVILFLGTVRNHSEAGKVDKIAYETYEPMAEKRLAAIEAEVKRIWPVRKVKTVHRVGKLSIGDVSVAVAVSADHRREAFEACRHAIERIKHEVPMWKKERLGDGTEAWVEGTPIGDALRVRQR